MASTRRNKLDKDVLNRDRCPRSVYACCLSPSDKSVHSTISPGVDVGEPVCRRPFSMANIDPFSMPNDVDTSTYNIKLFYLSFMVLLICRHWESRRLDEQRYNPFNRTNPSNPTCHSIYSSYFLTSLCSRWVISLIFLLCDN